MTTPILTLAEVQALAGFTEGPWRMSIENGGGVVAGHRHAIVSAYSSPLGWPCVQVEQASKPLVLAAPALHATCLHLHAEVARLTAELEKPVVGPWRRESFGNQVRWHASAGEGDRIAAIARVPGDCRGGWLARGFWGLPKSSGPEAGDSGKRAADLALVAAGYRLVGGVFGEVSDGT